MYTVLLHNHKILNNHCHGDPYWSLWVDLTLPGKVVAESAGFPVAPGPDCYEGATIYLHKRMHLYGTLVRLDYEINLNKGSRYE